MIEETMRGNQGKGKRGSGEIFETTMMEGTQRKALTNWASPAVRRG